MLRLLLGVTVLLLLLCPQAVRSDCSLPPHVPNAQPDLEGRTSFPEGSTVTYKCNKDFVNVPGKLAAITCLKDNEWSLIAEFCNRSCDVPTRLLFAALKRPYNQQNYFPAGSVVEYECRRGYRRNHSLSGKVTCLQNFTWSKPDEFCEKTSCPNPGKVINGYVNITTDILFGASIIFSCNAGYELVGAPSSYCMLKGDTVDWSDPLPECKGSSHISKVTPQKPTTVNVPGTKVLSTLQKPSTVNIPAAQSPAVTVKATPFNLRTTTSSHSGTLPAGELTLIWTCIYNSDSFAYDANNHWLIDLAKEDIRRKHTQVHRIFLVLYKFLEAWTQYMQYCSLFCTLPLSLRCTGISVK
ncbi:complement decay-accelerating factor isoform 6-T7 [Hipposideros larvatus]